MELPHRYRAGLIVLGVLSALDLTLPLLTDGQHPPMPVALAAAALGVICLVLVARAWLGGRGILVLVGLRALSAAAAAPALLSAGAPAAAKATAGLVVALTALGSGLALSGGQRPRPGATR